MFTFLHRIAFRVMSLLRRGRIEDEFDSEIQAHVELLTEENIRRGMSPGEARRAAVLIFGGVSQTQERHRQSRGIAHLEALRQDARFAFRQMRRSPGFTAVAVLTLALGIGACTAIFSLVDGVLLKPLPFSNPEHLVWIWSSAPRSGELKYPVSGADYLDWAQQSHSFERLAAIRRFGATLTGAGDPELVIGERVSANFLATLGAAPLLGRGFLPEDEKPGSDQVVILGNELWRGRFGGDAGIIGRQVKLDSRNYTVVGVMSPDFMSFDDTRIWLPYSFGPDEMSRYHKLVNVIARLRPGVAITQARQEMDVITDRLQRQYPESNTDRKALIVPLREHLVGDSKTPLLALLGAVGLVLLIVCANIANLFLARAASREKEVAIRIALGATRSRLFRQLLTESLIISFGGGILGVTLAYLATPALISLSPSYISHQFPIGINGQVLSFTSIVSLLAGLGFGLLPALGLSRPNLNPSLKEAGQVGKARFGQARINDLLIVSEIALALILLIGTGLLIKTFLSLRNGAGFNSANVTSLEINLPQSRYSQKQQQGRVFQELLERVQALPAVQGAGLVNDLPLAGSSTTGSFDIEGRPDWPAGQEPTAEKNIVSAGYFRAMGISVLHGREFASSDAAGAPAVVIINEAMARKFWPNENPVGKRLNLGWHDEAWQEIIGVVGDVKQQRLDAATSLQAYAPFLQVPRLGMRLIYRCDGNPQSQIPSVRAILKSIDPDLPVFSVRDMDSILSKSVETQRLNMFLFGIFAAAALFLAAVGTYGVISYSVTQRTREIGIRLALGARPAGVIWMVIARGGVLSLAGIAVGLFFAFMLTRAIASLLYEVSATDPATFVIASATLACTAIFASYLPARRASGVDPMIALRNE